MLAAMNRERRETKRKKNEKKEKKKKKRRVKSKVAAGGSLNVCVFTRFPS